MGRTPEAGVGMALPGSSILSVILGAAAMLLALALLVQVLQEMWKHLLSTRAAVYTKVLHDFLGPAALLLAEPGVLTDLKSRGPFQFLRLRPQGKLLPLGREDLIEGLERTTSVWMRRALRALRAEVALQNGAVGPPSAAWRRFLRELDQTAPGGPGDSDRRDLLQFFAEESGGASSELVGSFDAARVLRALRERFMPYALDAERHFGRLGALFEFQYGRRNLLLSFTFGVAAAFLLGFPIQTIIQRSSAMSPEETAALASSVVALSEQVAAAESASVAVAQPGQPLPDSIAKQLSAARDSLLGLLGRLQREAGAAAGSAAGAKGDGVLCRLAPSQFARGCEQRTSVMYLLGCLVTGLLISFGAPFWNDLLGALGGKARPAPVGAGGARA